MDNEKLRFESFYRWLEEKVHSVLVRPLNTAAYREILEKHVRFDHVTFDIRESIAAAADAVDYVPWAFDAVYFEFSPVAREFWDKVIRPKIVDTDGAKSYSVQIREGTVHGDIRLEFSESTTPRERVAIYRHLVVDVGATEGGGLAPYLASRGSGEVEIVFGRISR